MKQLETTNTITLELVVKTCPVRTVVESTTRVNHGEIWDDSQGEWCPQMLDILEREMAMVYFGTVTTVVSFNCVV